MPIANIVRDVSNCRVLWDRPAVLQHLDYSTLRGARWIGEQRYDGTVAGAVRHFKSLPAGQQERVEMFLDSGVISALEEDTIIGADDLRALASRPDLPEA